MTMRSTRQPGDLDRMLIAGDPAPPRTLVSEGVEHALDEIGIAIVSHARRRAGERPRRRIAKSRGLVLIAAAVVSIAGGAAAATRLLSAHTGQYARGWEIKAGGPGEYLRMSGHDFCQVALRLSSDIPYPAGYEAWRPWVLISELQVPRVTTTGACASRGGADEVSTGATHGFFAMSGFCAWVYAWRHDTLAGDTAGAGHAGAVIEAAPRWKAVTAEDPHPSAGPLRNTRGGLTGNTSIFGWFLPFRSAVLHGDLSTVQRLIASHYGTAGCSYFDPPASSHGGTVLPARWRP